MGCIGLQILILKRRELQIHDNGISLLLFYLFTFLLFYLFTFLPLSYARACLRSAEFKQAWLCSRSIAAFYFFTFKSPVPWLGQSDVLVDELELMRGEEMTAGVGDGFEVVVLSTDDFKLGKRRLTTDAREESLGQL